MHDRLRQALRVARESLDATDADPTSTGPKAAGADAATRDLLLYCHGFCVALGSHHLSEDVRLFPLLEEQHPELRETLAKLRQDHSMIAHLLTQLEHSVNSSPTIADLERHLEGLGAVMESHFRYEERQLLGILAELRTTADRDQMLGPL